MINIKYDPYKTSSAWPPDELRLHPKQGAAVWDTERQMLDKSIQPHIQMRSITSVLFRSLVFANRTYNIVSHVVAKSINKSKEEQNIRKLGLLTCDAESKSFKGNKYINSEWFMEFVDSNNQ